MNYKREAFGNDVLDFGVLYKDKEGNVYSLQSTWEDGMVLLDCDTGEEIFVEKVFRDWKTKIHFTKYTSLGYIY